jgi:hypothetical protein
LFIFAIPEAGMVPGTQGHIVTGCWVARLTLCLSSATSPTHGGGCWDFLALFPLVLLIFPSSCSWSLSQEARGRKNEPHSLARFCCRTTSIFFCSNLLDNFLSPHSPLLLLVPSTLLSLEYTAGLRIKFQILR